MEKGYSCFDHLKKLIKKNIPEISFEQDARNADE
jgi:hypothetical protein